MTATTSGELWPEVRPEAARRLLLAAVDSFATRGYHATTTRDIATAAGMSPAALYVHYPSKAALLFEISRTGHRRALALVEAAAADGTDPVRQMRRLTEDFTTWHARTHRVGRIVQYELHSLAPEHYAVVAELRRRTEEIVRSMISEGVAAGAFDVPDVRTAARAVLSLSIDVARWYDERTAAEPAEALGRRYADLVLRMLGASLEGV